MGYYSIMIKHDFNPIENISEEYEKWCECSCLDPMCPYIDDRFKAYYDWWDKDYLGNVAKNMKDGSWFVLRGEEGEQEKYILKDGEWDRVDGRLVWDDDPVHEELRMLREIYNAHNDEGLEDCSGI